MNARREVESEMKEEFKSGTWFGVALTVLIELATIGVIAICKWVS
jgi:hypothetical protein